MVRAAFSPARHAARCGDQGIGDGGSGRGGAMLIGHDIEAFTLRAEAEHRLHEVCPMGRNNPACPEDQMEAPLLRIASSPASFERP